MRIWQNAASAVVPQSAEYVQAFVFAECGPSGDSHRGYGERALAVAALYGPVEEGPQAVAVVLAVLGPPGVDVGLAAGGEGGVPLAEPGEEGGRVLDLLGGEAADAGGDVGVFGQVGLCLLAEAVPAHGGPLGRDRGVGGGELGRDEEGAVLEEGPVGGAAGARRRR
ncbi:hypothetical protein [Streptomyces clavuligerus]|uniref:hypothetical protein n=1 Tax=Streptomyces clavuligerus TaxID=1901 RepID=UPI0015751A3D|nr:hypothetical protein [Streptomyces clavuligerus]MBY6307665.1 hypothetical protein [Streptomyces clavuligerus]WDN56492.1 hypothetical protein LL058_32165 [Streptomyces clavuligerus]